MTYRDEITKAMTALGTRPDVVFLGQAVAFPGTAMYGTLEGVPTEKRIELPVMEDSQLGLCIGMSLNGFLPVCIFPRINFLLLAMSQLVLHLDKIPLYGNGYQPKVIVRTAVASDQPLDPGVQHLGDYGPALKLMLSTVRVRELTASELIEPLYAEAADSRHSTLLIERAEMYDRKG